MPLAHKGPDLATVSVPGRGPGADGESGRVVRSFPLWMVLHVWLILCSCLH